MKCHTCDGTGQLTLHRGWIVQTKADFYKVRCGICSGTGESSHRCYAYETEQSKMRSQFVSLTASRKQGA